MADNTRLHPDECASPVAVHLAARHARAAGSSSLYVAFNDRLGRRLLTGALPGSTWLSVLAPKARP